MISQHRNSKKKSICVFSDNDPSVRNCSDLIRIVQKIWAIWNQKKVLSILVALTIHNCYLPWLPVEWYNGIQNSTCSFFRGMELADQKAILLEVLAIVTLLYMHFLLLKLQSSHSTQQKTFKDHNHLFRKHYWKVYFKVSFCKL